MVSRTTAGAAFAGLCVIWGSTWLGIKIGLSGAPPFLAAALRFALAVAVLLPLVAWRRSKMPTGRTEWALVIVVGIALYTLDYGLIYWGENSGVESGLSAILFATFVLQTAVFAQALLRNERLTAQKLAGIGVGFGGILLIFHDQVTTVGIDKLVPMLAIVLSATCAAFSTAATKRWGHDTDPISFTAFSMLVGAAGLFALSLGARETWSPPSWPAGILAIVYLGIFGSVVAFVTYWWLLKSLEATTMSYIAMVTPIVAVFLGVTVGSEVLDVLTLVGTAVTLAGIYLAVNRRIAAWGGRVSARAGDPLGPDRERVRLKR